MLYSCQKAAYSIIFTMRHVAGHSYDGIKLVRLPVKSAACKWEALPYCCHAASPCFRALNLYAVQSISKVSLNVTFLLSLFCCAALPVDDVSIGRFSDRNDSAKHLVNFNFPNCHVDFLTASTIIYHVFDCGKRERARKKTQARLKCHLFSRSQQFTHPHR